MYCLRARPCSFQPGNFTGWGSEGVKISLTPLTYHHSYYIQYSVGCSGQHSHVPDINKNIMGVRGWGVGGGGYT